jgi:hypothetical protein
MMNRWGWRLVGIILVLIFLMMLFRLQRQLIELQQERAGVPATGTS